MARAKIAGDHVAILVTDPASPPETVLVGGYLGPSAHDGYERLYLTADLNAHVDIPHGDILHRKPVPGDPLNATHVWVRKDSHVLHKGDEPPATDAQEDGSKGVEPTPDS